MPSPHLPTPAQTFAGRYRVRRELGRGSLGTVLLVEDVQSETDVALKLLRVDADPDAVETMRAEFRSISGLRHPHIATALDFGYSQAVHSRRGGVPFYTREYVAGEPLRPGPPPPDGSESASQFLRPILQLLDALEYLHSHGVAHRDIHPGNVIERVDERDSTRNATLIDGGLTVPGAVSGRSEPSDPAPPWEYPASVEGVRADLYLVGRLLLYRLTGRHSGEPHLPDDVAGWGVRTTLELERVIRRALALQSASVTCWSSNVVDYPSAAAFRASLASAIGTKITSTRAEPRDVLVGREREIGRFENELDRSESGECRARVLEAASGAGKTRLFEEFRCRAQLRGFDVIAVCFHANSIGESPVLAALRAQRAHHGRWHDVLSLAAVGSTAERARRAVASYFNEPGPPLVLLIDDGQFADSESLALIEAFLESSRERTRASRRTRGVAIVISSVTGTFPCSLRNKERWPLNPLSANRAAELFRTWTQPLAIPGRIATEAAGRANGNLVKLRQLAARSRRDAQRDDVVEMTSLPAPESVAEIDIEALPNAARLALEALVVMQRPATAGEVAAAIGQSPSVARRALQALAAEELLTTSSSYGGRTTRVVIHPQIALSIAKRVHRITAARQIHQRLYEYLGRRVRPTVEDLTARAHHAIELAGERSGKRRARCCVTVAVDALLQKHGHAGATQLLQRALDAETSIQARRRYIEQLSDVYRFAGDHADAARTLREFLKQLPALQPAEMVRLHRRLAVHLHRSGDADGALQAFDRLRRLACPHRDLGELVFVESELAELHTLRGRSKEAAAACARGLSLLQNSPGLPPAFRHEMETLLMASRGHLALRNLQLSEAITDLRAAAKLARQQNDATVTALILNNLGNAYNQSNTPARAVQTYRQVHRLSRTTNDGDGALLATANLATLSAKLGRFDETRAWLVEAASLAERLPDAHMRFREQVSRGMAFHWMGETDAALAAFSRARPVGESLGDSQGLFFIELYSAEILTLCAGFREARTLIRRAKRRADELRSPALTAVVEARRSWIDASLGHSTPDTSATTDHGLTVPPALFAWNVLFRGESLRLTGMLLEADRQLKIAGERFQQAEMPAPARWAHLLRLLASVDRHDNGQVRSLLLNLDRAAPAPPHRFLLVLEPYARAAAALTLDDRDGARRHWEEASTAISGQPFLELDWRIECLGAQIARVADDIASARRHVSRSVHTQQLIAAALPRRWRERFRNQAQFTPLRKLHSDLTESCSTPTLVRDSVTSSARLQIVANSASMRAAVSSIESAAESGLPVLLRGETGSGKELFAKLLHECSARRRGPFFVLACASLPAELFEAELFGHAAGAFTGAETDRSGILESMAGGTLVLDEITALEIGTQAKLLRVLESKKLRPIGSVDTRPVDVLFVATTCEDLGDLSQSGRFRADLLYRLARYEVCVPPLRQRREDIDELAQLILDSEARRLSCSPPLMTPSALERLRQHTWPGNVRELQTVLMRVLTTAGKPAPTTEEHIESAMVDGRVCASEAQLFSRRLLAGRPLHELRRSLERAYVTYLFEDTGGDVKAMRDALDMPQATLYRWIKRLGLDLRELRRRL